MKNELIYNYEPLWADWRVENFIGKGSIGSVYKISKTINSKKYYSAVKLITVPTENQIKTYENSIGNITNSSFDEFVNSIVNDIIKEIEFLYELKGTSNILNIEEYMIKEDKESNKKHIFIRMEYSMPLKEYLESNSFDEDNIVKLIKDVGYALKLCHNKNIIHRDIKEENIFYSESINSFKIGDFSVSKKLSDDTIGNTKVGTLNYMAPEIIRGESYSKNVDIYSLGLVIYKLLNNNRSPFLNPSKNNLTLNDIEMGYVKRIRGEKIDPPINGSQSLKTIVLKCCEFNSLDRYQSVEDLEKDLNILKNQDNITNNEKTKNKEDTLLKETIPFFNANYNGDNLKNNKPKFKKIYFIFAAIILLCISSATIISRNFLESGNGNGNNNDNDVTTNIKFENTKNSLIETYEPDSEEINAEDEKSILPVKEPEDETKASATNDISTENNISQTPTEEKSTNTSNSTTTSTPTETPKVDGWPEIGKRYYIKNLGTGKYLNVDGNSSANAAGVSIFTIDYTSGQKFTLSSNSNGIMFVPDCNTGCVNIYSDDAYDGCNVNIYKKSGSTTQTWKIVSVSSGYKICSVYDSTLVLNAAGNTDRSNVNVKVYNSSKNQIWIFDEV